MFVTNMKTCNTVVIQSSSVSPTPADQKDNQFVSLDRFFFLQDVIVQLLLGLHLVSHDTVSAWDPPAEQCGRSCTPQMAFSLNLIKCFSTAESFPFGKVLV